MRWQGISTVDLRSARRVIELIREVIKLGIILIYTGFATTLLVTAMNPLAFAPLLSWALWSGWRGRDPDKLKAADTTKTPNAPDRI